MKYYSSRKFDLVVVGSGLAGSAAACFATKRGLRVAQVSASGGEMAFASGVLDVLHIFPPGEQKRWDNPWEGVAALAAASPRHPYARLGAGIIRGAMEEFVEFLRGAGLEYRGLPDRNVTIPTAAGTAKTTYRVPQSMWNGVAALEGKLPTLLVDFTGMKDFNAGMIAEVLRPEWPDLRSIRVPFPKPLMGVDRPNLVLAEALESESVLAGIAEAVWPQLGNARMIGMPAVLGLRSAPQVVADLEERLGVGVFEIPTLPPSVPGCRLREAVDAALVRDGVEVLQGRRALSVRTDGRRCAGIVTGAEEWRETLEADGIVLATGRFLGGGLSASQEGIAETLFGLPVTHPGKRTLWHRDRFLDHRGHPVNEAGLEIDARFRPLGKDGAFAFENVFAAGSILAHQDWVRTKSGAGLAVSTALAAVEAFLRLRTGG